MVAYRYDGAVDLEKLLDYIPDSNGEPQYIQALMRKSRLSLAEAKEKYPDWYERRVVKQERWGRWIVKRNLYDWWLHRITDGITAGHRFYSIIMLGENFRKFYITCVQNRACPSYIFLNNEKAAKLKSSYREKIPWFICVVLACVPYLSCMAARAETIQSSENEVVRSVQQPYYLDWDSDKALRRMALEGGKNLMKSVNDALRAGLTKYL